MTWLTHIPLLTYKHKYELVDFVETGTWRGDGLSYAKSCGYENLFSCDINEEYASSAIEKYPFAVIYNSESIVFMENVLPSINNKTLFWLDAHFPGHYGTDETPEQFRLPLMAELNMIKTYKKGYEHDVIICDDIRNLRCEENPRYREGELSEEFLLDLDWNEFVHFFDDTHVAVLTHEHDGVMTFFPKDKYTPEDEYFTYRT